MQLDLPPPLPDEAIYSALARARHRLGWATTRFAQRLFAGRTIIVRPHLCGQLDLLAATMTRVAGWSFSSEHLRAHHTLFPLVSPFVETRFHDKCVSAIHGDRVSRHHVGLCRQVLGVTAFTQLKSCPQCRREDRRHYGESYLHCIHQVSGVMRCAHHGSILQECDITAEPEFYTALDEIKEFRSLRVSAGRRDRDCIIASEVRDLQTMPAAASSMANGYANLLRLASQRMGPNASTVVEMITLAVTTGCPLSVVTGTGPTRPTPAIRPAANERTDQRWLRHARRILPGRIAILQASYRRRIVWLTLRREIEAHFRARLPARAHIPRTAAFLDTLVESKTAASHRLTAMHPHEERSAA